MKDFQSIPIVGNFYQTSSFIPMPTTLIGTLDENNETSFGAYSLIFPYYVGSKGYYAMILMCRNSSNTCKHLLCHGKCTINFMPDHKKYFHGIVALGFPGDSPEYKRKINMFTPREGLLKEEHPEGHYPKMLEEAFQVFECSWVRELDNAQDDVFQEEYPGPYHDFNGITSEYGAHFILKIEKILVKEKYAEGLRNGGLKPSSFPPIPTNFGYRESMYFWESQFRQPLREPVPRREVDLETVRYAANRADETVKFTDDALQQLILVPRVFLTLVVRGCVKWAKEHDVTLITAAEMELINEERKHGGNTSKGIKNRLTPILVISSAIVAVGVSVFAAFKIKK